MTERSFWADKKILLTGGAGFLGFHVAENLRDNLGVKPNQVVIPRSSQTDLRDPQSCLQLVKGIDIVIHLAARVGGIGFNRKFPGTLFYDNIMMGANLMEAARQEHIEKFVQVGTVCAYPKFTPVPFREDDLWNGFPEETNAPYGIAKKALLTMAQSYRAQYGMNIIYLLPVNLYGPQDNFDLESSHVIPALIRKFSSAVSNQQSEVLVWGTGEPSREFLYVNDAAKGLLMATERYNKPDPVNLGSGKEVRISELVQLIANLTGFHGKISYDTSKPDGQPRRSLDTSRAKSEFGFEATTELLEGLKATIDWYKRNHTQTTA